MYRQGKIVASIEARFGSTRLSGKIMKEIAGKPMLEFLVERVKRARMIDDIVIATAKSPDCDVVEELARHLGVLCFRGSEDDVLDRVLKAAQSAGADHVVELWGDNPLIDPRIIDKAVDYYRRTDADCVGTCLDHTYPVGQSVLVFSTRILEEIARITNDPVDRENVSNYIYEHPERYTILNLPCPAELHRQDIRLTVDEPADFKMVKTIAEQLYASNPAFSVRDVIRFIDEHPRLTSINMYVRQRTLRHDT